MNTNNPISNDVSGGELATLSREEFVARYIPQSIPAFRVRAIDFLKGRTHSEAIEAALAVARAPGSYAVVVLDSQDWLIDRAIRLPSDTELVIDACRLKLADGVHDNLIRVAGLTPNPADPNGACLSVEPTVNIRINGRNGAVLEGADQPYTAANPKTGVVEPWVGDYFGWRTVGILLSATTRYEVSGFTMQKTHCWAISQDLCTYGCVHDIHFTTDVKNGDGIDFRNGCSWCMVDTITGTTSDDTVACTALAPGFVTSTSKYIYPLQPMGMAYAMATGPDIHDIVIRNIRTGGRHHGVICLATSPSVYNITIDGVVEDAASARESCVRVYTGYGTGYKPGNLRNIVVTNVVSRGAQCAVIVKAGVKDVRFSNIRQLNPGAAVHCFEGDSENLSITLASDGDAKAVTG